MTDDLRIRAARPDERERLLEIWQAAVLATHQFVTAEDLEVFARIVREEYLPSASFWVAVGADDLPLGFMGATGGCLDSLFVDPAFHGRGVGTALVGHLCALQPCIKVDVNEQNAGAIAFYRRLGFEATGRSERDSAGKSYPILHMRRNPRQPC